MTRKVELGAPSLSGKDANDLVASEFAAVNYPLKVVVTNHMPRDVVFPEVDGLFLRHCANEAGRQLMVELASEDQFQRLASSIEQIAELNAYALAITIEEIEAEGEVAAKGKGKGKTTSAELIQADPVQEG